MSLEQDRLIGKHCCRYASFLELLGCHRLILLYLNDFIWFVVYEGTKWVVFQYHRSWDNSVCCSGCEKEKHNIKLMVEKHRN